MGFGSQSQNLWVAKLNGGGSDFELSAMRLNIGITLCTGY